MRIGILGGTFDPVHAAHLQMASRAKEVFHLDRMFLIPTRPWQKTARASDEHRLEMLRLAVKEANCPAEIDSREIDQAGQSYSIRTLFAYRMQFGPEAELFFVMGSDQWKNLTTWVQWEKFPDLTNIALFQRGDIEFEDPYSACLPIINIRDAVQFNPSGAIYVCEDQIVAASSTEIRKKLFQEPERSKEIQYLSPVVHDYILKNQLYLPREGSHKP